MNPNLRNFALWTIIFLLVLALVTLFQNQGSRQSSIEIPTASSSTTSMPAAWSAS